MRLELIGSWHSMLTPASSGTVDRRRGAATLTRLLPQLVNSLSDTPMLSRSRTFACTLLSIMLSSTSAKNPATVFW